MRENQAKQNIEQQLAAGEDNNIHYNNMPANPTTPNAGYHHHFDRTATK